jgi:hypothetical protein
LMDMVCDWNKGELDLFSFEFLSVDSHSQRGRCYHYIEIQAYFFDKLHFFFQNVQPIGCTE